MKTRFVIYHRLPENHLTNAGAWIDCIGMGSFETADEAAKALIPVLVWKTKSDEYKIVESIWCHGRYLPLKGAPATYMTGTHKGGN